MYLAHPVTIGAGAVFIIAALILYRRRGREDGQHGSQGAVILLILGAILAIHGLGMLEYHPMRID